MRQARGPAGTTGRFRAKACLLGFFAFAAVVFFFHAPFLGLPYYWDEAGQFVPAALDILHGGSWVAHSTVPNIHPPAVAGFLAAVWSVAGYNPVVTRAAMLLVSSAALFAAFLLALELSKESRIKAALLAAALLLASPLFFAQSMMAQLDAPAMLFSTLALLWFLQGRIRAAAAGCVALVLVKETGIALPLTFAAWLIYERRWRDAAWFLAPAAALAGWIAVLVHTTGHWAGNPGFVRYNLDYPLQPVRLLVAVARRVYYLCLANLHWVGTAAVLFVWRTSHLFHSREWRIAWLAVAAQTATVTFLGGALLERYLLPVMPVIYAAMAAAFWRLGRVARITGSAALLCGLAAANFINPPYPFPYENNLAFTDFVRLHAAAARYLEQNYPAAPVHTAWPLTEELSLPSLGYVSKRLPFREMRDFTPQSLSGLNWSSVKVLAVYSRNWNPVWDVTRYEPVEQLRTRLLGYVREVGPEDMRAMTPFPRAAHFELRGQWVDVYVNPSP